MGRCQRHAYMKLGPLAELHISAAFHARAHRRRERSGHRHHFRADFDDIFGQLLSALFASLYAFAIISPFRHMCTLRALGGSIATLSRFSREPKWSPPRRIATVHYHVTTTHDTY